MVARGIPAEKILEEHRSLNTGENVMFSLPVIDAALGLKNIRSVICLGNTWTARQFDEARLGHGGCDPRNAGARDAQPEEIGRASCRERVLASV